MTDPIKGKVNVPAYQQINVKGGRTEKAESVAAPQAPSVDFKAQNDVKEGGMEALGLQNLGLQLSQKVDVGTTQELNDLYKMAGISSKYIPTQAVYSRIADGTNVFAANFEAIQTENNAQQLFNSDKFQQLNDIALG
ncbi:MAG: hypothetical protein LKG27_06590 [Clostridiaceae bacterium]|jgi:hypothetical protein|nr:hypothetical protein [Clostridiaceae bacterium]